MADSLSQYACTFSLVNSIEITNMKKDTLTENRLAHTFIYSKNCKLYALRTHTGR